MSAFEGIKGLNSITIPATVDVIGDSAFYDCHDLMRDNNGYLEISSATKIGKRAFGNCDSLRKVVLTGNVAELGGSVFQNCSGLKEFVFNASQLKTISFYMFGGCSNLEAVDIISSIEKIEGSAFMNCSSLKYISFPTSLLEIGASAFSGCVALEDVYIPETVEVIEDYVFYGCTSDLTVMMQADSAKDGYSEKFSYINNNTSVNVEWGVQP